MVERPHPRQAVLLSSAAQVVGGPRPTKHVLGFPVPPILICSLFNDCFISNQTAILIVKKQSYMKINFSKGKSVQFNQLNLKFKTSGTLDQESTFFYPAK